ncbi:hypothetical protein [Paraburkholderia sp. CNPSo 3281]|uniref:hypothetical protein n=1 Tax=Paraburkholderia sp. CNPSo 3281 TaxID=2940933 RepID=UPI0020B6B0A5|nr:hypothetical protein [Paraburkholderia sp. CNPSo 3281]MCP3715401.1 hypothetical protein [Paraburkholderia sp. CNPSo 3281]
MHITLDTAKAIYRNAIDSRASDGEGATWWDEVADEIRNVVAARSICAAHLSSGVTVVVRHSSGRGPRRFCRQCREYP